MQEIEQITYETGRSALSDQEALVARIQQRTGTLLAAHALVASFLGSTTLRAQGSSVFTWLAVTALVTGLIVAAVVLAPWPLRFALDVRDVYEIIRDRTSDRVGSSSAEWLTAVGFAHQELHNANDPAVQRMSWLSGALAILMVSQTLAWTAALLVH
ncbi:MAG: hypothetical protein WB698_01255 [Solirubrobacteraceae bacterium]